MKYVVMIAFVTITSATYAQKKVTTRFFHASLTPGISTNGLHPGSYSNIISLNLTSGYAHASKLFEVGVISNLNESETRGIQFAGIANTTGANAFAGLTAKEMEKKQRDGFEANLHGIQSAGLANVVLNNVFGAQITGGFNVIGGGLIGIQLSGICNAVKKYAFGLQIAGLANKAESMDGTQLSSLMNYVSGELHGIQVALLNKAKVIEGKNSYEIKNRTGLQLGAWNRSNTMNGFQIGVVNIAGRMQGTQLGLINIYRNGKSPGTRDGTAIGLINVGSTGYASVYATDVFATNFEIATGTVKNRRVSDERVEKQVQNALIYSTNPGFLPNSGRWGIGYGLKKMFFNRSATPGFSHYRFWSLGVDMIHVSHTRKLERDLSLLMRPTLSLGSRFHPKNRIVFLFASVAYNLYASHAGYTLKSSTATPESQGSLHMQHNLGFSAGVLVQ